MASSSCPLRYKDKVTIVTGGSKGIGEGIVRVFGEAFNADHSCFQSQGGDSHI